ncbi:hypothetical protein LTR67_005998 [Exophiala xenobiotica]
MAAKEAQLKKQTTYPGSTSAPSSPPMQETPSRRSRTSEPEGRKRGESRSSSVPIVVRNPQGEEESEEEVRAQSRTQPHSREPSPSLHSSEEDPKTPSSHSRRSVKHLTCFWWWEKGHCRFSDEECLYSHYDTGHHTSAPRQVIPGEPAKAGKSLERELNKLGIHHRSSTSLSSINPTHGNGTGSSSITGSSRPVSPSPFGGDRASSRPATPATIEAGQVAQLRTDNDFLRTLVQQSQHEKATLVQVIESLKKEKDQLQSQSETMSTERTNLLHEREILHATIKKLQFANNDTMYMRGRSPAPGLAPYQSPWGAVGSRRASPADNAQPRAMSAEQEQQMNMNMNMHGNGNGNGVGTPAYNPNAMPYAPDTRFSTGAANEAAGEKLKNVLRNLGPGY